MGTDYAEKERMFVAGLEEDTGRPLTDWLAAITSTGLTARNDIIDWLRQNGFTFSNASWIERIHHNGGRLVYANDGTTAVDMPPPLPSRARTILQPVEPQPPVQPAPLPSAPIAIAPVVAAVPPSATLQTEVSAILAAAKGLRPLAELVLREIKSAVPEVEYGAQQPFVILSAPQRFAALLPGPKRLLLYADFEDKGSLDVRAASAIAKASPPYPHMLVLDDARVIGQSFRDAVASAARNVKA